MCVCALVPLKRFNQRTVREDGAEDLFEKRNVSVRLSIIFRIIFVSHVHAFVRDMAILPLSPILCLFSFRGGSALLLLVIYERLKSSGLDSRTNVTSVLNFREQSVSSGCRVENGSRKLITCAVNLARNAFAIRAVNPRCRICVRHPRNHSSSV